MKTMTRLTLMKKGDSGSTFGRSFIVPDAKLVKRTGFECMEFTLKGKLERVTFLRQHVVFQGREFATCKVEGWNR